LVLNLSQGAGLEVIGASDAYSDLLLLLEAAYAGRPEALSEGVIAMYRLKQLANELMRISTSDDQATVGPAWEYVRRSGAAGNLPT